MSFKLTQDDLKKSATTYKKQLLVTPIISCEETLQHMTSRPGVAGREIVSELGGNIELGPYDPTRVDNDGVNANARTLETFLGSVVKRFDVNTAATTVWGELVAQGKQLTTADLALQVLTFLSGLLGKKLNEAIWAAKRNDSGTTTKDLFNGFDTITKQEIDKSNISTSNGNLCEFAQPITKTNAVDMLMDFYDAAAEELQGVKTKLYVPFKVYQAYNRDYATRFGGTPYNKEYSKTFLEGTQNLCELVPLVSKKGSDYLHLTTKSNMLYGYGAGLAKENIAIEKYHEFLLSYVATMFFGTEFESIQKERLFVGKLHA
jgi:hypothetical protein